MRYMFLFFFFNDTATTEIYTLSLHDALPIYAAAGVDEGLGKVRALGQARGDVLAAQAQVVGDALGVQARGAVKEFHVLLRHCGVLRCRVRCLIRGGASLWTCLPSCAPHVQLARLAARAGRWPAGRRPGRGWGWPPSGAARAAGGRRPVDPAALRPRRGG